MKSPIIVLDKDGVIVDSEPIKLASFETLFEDYPAHRRPIHEYNHRSIGVPREDKLRYVCQEILGLAEVEKHVAALYQLSQEILKETVLEAPLLPGVIEFLEAYKAHLCYVCSAAPLPEVQSQISHHQLDPFFEHLYGFPSEKHEVLRMLVDTHDQPLVFFGDTMRDYRASQKAGVPFIGVSYSPDYDQFEGMEIPVIKGFSALGPLQRLIHTLLK